MKRKVQKKLSLGMIKVASLSKSSQAELKGGIRTIEAACNTTPVSVCPCLSTGTVGNLCSQDICRF